MLVEDCTPIRLLEVKTKSVSLASYGQEQSHFTWGLDCSGILVLFNIPISYPLPDYWLKDLETKTFPCLPTELRCCYGKFDGMGLPFATTPSYDLPGTEWVTIQEYCENSNIPQEAIEKILADFKGEDLRVFIVGSLGDLFLANRTKKDGIVLRTNTASLDQYEIVSKVEDLDEYFALAVKGFPRKPFT